MDKAACTSSIGGAQAVTCGEQRSGAEIRRRGSAGATTKTEQYKSAEYKSRGALSKAEWRVGSKE